MYSISEISKLTGITAFTLRYYESIGLLPKPQRLDGKQNGIRRYDDQDLRFIRFIYGLKQTGMKLEDIASFSEDGCLLTQKDQNMDTQSILHKRIEILDHHIDKLEEQIKQLETLKAIAYDKKALYTDMLN
jgi:DNA-binding transcriptional MerR regulator